MQYVQIPLHKSEVEDLIRLGLLQREQRKDAQALQAAVLTIVYQALDVAG